MLLFAMFCKLDPTIKCNSISKNAQIWLYKCLNKETITRNGNCIEVSLMDLRGGYMRMCFTHNINLQKVIVYFNFVFAALNVALYILNVLQKGIAFHKLASNVR